MKRRMVQQSQLWLFFVGLVAMILGFGVGASLPFFYFLFSNAVKWASLRWGVLIGTLLFNFILWRWNFKASIGIFWIFVLVGIGAGFLLLLMSMQSDPH